MTGFLKKKQANKKGPWNEPFLFYFSFLLYTELYALSFFKIDSSLVVRFPRTRWQANCVFRSVATRKHNETLRLWPGSAEQSEAIGARVRTQVRAFKSYNLCPDSSLRSRMTGKYLMLLRKKPFFRFCSHLPLPSASLTPSPTSGEGLRFVFFSF